MRNEKGIALMITLWVLVLLSVIAVNFAFSARLESAGTRNFKLETEAYYAAVTAYEEALSYLLTDKDPAVDFIDSDGIYWTDALRPSAAGKRTMGNIEVEVRILDEESRLNINTAPEATLRVLFANAGIPDEEIDGLIDSLSDWKDTDELHHLAGAESDYYEKLDMPYEAKNSLLSTPEELLLIKGFKPEYLYGREGIKPLMPHLSTLSTALNINTAPPEIFELLGLSSAEIDTIMKKRTPDAGGFRTIHESPVPGVPLTTASTHIRVEVIASVEGKEAVKLTAILRRASGASGPRLETIYWKEGLENSRA